MINQMKADIEKRTGLPPAVVDQVLSALGEIVAQRYPQYAPMISMVLGLPTSGTGTTAPAGTTGTGMPDLGGLGNEIGQLIGGGQGAAGTSQPATGGSGNMPDLGGLGNEIGQLIGGGQGAAGSAGGSNQPDLGGLGDEIGRLLGGQDGGTSSGR